MSGDAGRDRAADEAAERYEGWLDEAIELIRRAAAISSRRRRSCSAISISAADGRSTCSAPADATRSRSGGWGPPRSSAWTSVRDYRAGRASQRGDRSPAGWFVANVLDAPAELDATADLVYTGRGSLLWLQDLDPWAAVVARLLVPGGRLVLFEGHPFEWLVDGDDAGRWSSRTTTTSPGPRHPAAGRPASSTTSIPDAEQHWKFSRSWTLGEIVSAVAGAGLRIERLVEYPRDWWSGHGDIAPEERGRLPLSFGLIATRPA